MTGLSRRWRLIVWLFLLSTVAYLDRVNLSAAGSQLQADYGLTSVQLGLLFSAFVLGYALFQAPAGRAADIVGSRRALTGAVVWWAVFSALPAMIPRVSFALALLVAARFALGAGEAVMYPASNRIVAAWIPVRERGLATGLIFTGVGMGTAFAPLFVTPIIIKFGWRASFPACGVIGLIVGACWYLAARDTPTEDSRLSARELAVIRAGIPSRESATLLQWSAIAFDRNVQLLTISYFCYGYSAYIFFTWFYIYLNKTRGLDLRTSALYTALPGLGMAIGSFVGGLLNDHLTRQYGRWLGRCGVASLAIFIAAVLIALGPTVSSARLAAIVLACGAGTLYFAQSSFWSVSADIAGPSAGAVSGVMNMGANLGGFVTALSTPWIGERFGWSTALFVAASLCVVGAIAWTRVRPDREIAIAAGN